MNRKIIDFHCHIFPEKVAEKAVKNIGGFYGIEMDRKGVVPELLNIASKNKISKMVVHSTATREDQVFSINDFIISQCNSHKEFIGFGTLHPDYPDIEGEIERIINNNLFGLKIHPDFQMVNIDDERMFKIYEIASNKLPILFHVGDKHKDFSNPLRLKKVAELFPNLKIIAAHLGGYSVWDEASELFYDKENIWFDTCSSFDFLSDEKIKELIYKKGIEKILFASDYPMWKAEDEISRLNSLGFSDNELDMLYYKNACQLLNIQI